MRQWPLHRVDRWPMCLNDASRSAGVPSVQRCARFAFNIAEVQVISALHLQELSVQKCRRLTGDGLDVLGRHRHQPPPQIRQGAANGEFVTDLGDITIIGIEPRRTDTHLFFFAPTQPRLCSGEFPCARRSTPQRSSSSPRHPIVRQSSQLSPSLRYSQPAYDHRTKASR